MELLFAFLCRNPDIESTGGSERGYDHRLPIFRLHERFPALAGSLPHLVLSERPTPVGELPGPWHLD